MLVSIVTVYYNREAFVKDSINSLLDQSYKDIEIIAIDDGSTDNTLNLLKGIQDNRLKVISQENQGFVQSLLNAISISKGEYIAIHGSGDISFPTRIEKQVGVLNENPDIGVVTNYFENVNIITHEKWIKKAKVNKTIELNDILQNNPMVHGSTMFRKGVFEKAGGYRHPFIYAQDYDLWLRIGLISKYYIIPEVLYQRLIIPGAVASSVEKKVIRSMLSDFAKQNIQIKKVYGYDMVDKYGVHSLLLRKRSKKRANMVLGYAIQEWINGNENNWNDYIQLSMNEGKTFSNSTAYLIINLFYKNKVLKIVSTKVLQYMKNMIIKNKKEAK